MATLPGLRVGLTLDSATFIRETRRVQAELSTLNRSFAVAGTAVKALGAAFGGLIGGLSVTALAQAGKNALDMAGGLKELAQQAGVTTRELQILQFAGTQFGVSSEQISTSLAQFGIRLGKAAEDGKGLNDTLQRYSISLKDANGQTRSSYDLLGDLAEAVQNASSRTEQLAIAAEAFGARVGSKMLPMLLKGREGLEEVADVATRVGLILGDELVNEADRASDAISAMQFSFSKGFQIGVVEAFAGAVGGTTEQIKTATEAGKEFGKVIGSAMSGALELIGKMEPLLNAISGTFSGMNADAEKFGNLLSQSQSDAQGFGDWLRDLGLISDDLDSVNRRLTDLEATRRETVATMEKQGALEQAVARQTLVGIDEQIAALEQEKAELVDLEKQNAALNRSIVMGVKTIDQWTASLLGGASAAHQAADAAKDASREIEKIAALGMADVEFEVSNAPVAAAKKEVEAFEASLKEKEQLQKQASQRAAQAAKQAADTAKRDAERAAEEALAPWIKSQQSIFEISEDFTNRANQQKFDSIQDAAREEERIREKAADASQRQLEREAEERADLLLEPIRNAAQSIQSTLSDTFVEIFDGGITSAQDFADALVDIMKRAAADIAAALIMKPVMAQLAGGVGGAADAAMINERLRASTGAGGMGPHGMIPSGGATSLVPGQRAGGFPLSLGQTLGYGVAGGIGGFALGSSLFGGGPGSQIGGGLGGTGGAIGGALIGSLVPGIGTAVGGLAGGLLGGLGGGFLGSLFGGGDDGKQRSATIGGGALGGTGSGLAAQFAAGIDQQLQQALTTSQEALVNAVLRTSEAIKLTFDKEKGLSEGDKQRITAARLGPTAQALGIGNVGAVTAGTAEQQMAQFQEALTAKKAIDDLRASLTPFNKQTQDLTNQFSELTDSAAKYGISIVGLDEVHRRAAEQLRREQALTWNAAAEAVGAIRPLDRALADLGIQMQQAKANAEALGISTANLDKQYGYLQAQIINQQQLQNNAVNELIGNITPMQRALADLSVQFDIAGRQAVLLGLSTANISAAHGAAAQAVVEQFRNQQTPVQVQQQTAEERRREQLQRSLEFHAVKESVGAFTPLQRALSDLQVNMQDAAAEARALGISTAGVAKAHSRAAAEIMRAYSLQWHAAAEAVGTISPFSRAIADLGIQMQQAQAEARALGISTAGLAKRHSELYEALIRQRNAEFFTVAEQVGTTTPLHTALELLSIQMQEAAARARELGVPLHNIAARHAELANALIAEAEATKKATQAAKDQELLAAFNPFEGMIDQLRELGIELDRGVLNPLQQLEAAAQNFRDIANQASAGSVEAIQQFDEAARGFIQTAESVGASPGRVAAIQEVQGERQALVGQLQSAQAEAQRGFERAIQVASDREVDTLRELISEFRTLARRLA